MAVAYKDYYKILGVEKTADAKAIKQAYRRLARKHHPDTNPGNKGAAERFKEISEAYTVLSDPEKRRRYDTLGPDWQRYAQGFPGAGGGPGNFGDFHVRVEPGGDLGDFSDFFRTLFGDLGAGGRGSGRGAPAADDFLGDVLRGRGRGAPRGQDYQTPVEISLEEAAQGTRRTIELELSEPCPTCGGTGRQGQAPCPSCRGSGEVTRPRRVEVKIPAGVRDGARVRAAGEGGSGSGGGARGDLYLQVRVAPHPTFERREDDLYVDLPLAPWEAALGAEVEVPTLRGKVSMKIPPETSSGKAFRLPGYGVPHLRGGGQGDQFVRVKVVIPTGLTPREKELFEELRRLRPRLRAD
ncbi:MAG TPA: DnaJ C-terminal domain-containing protein [Methylomirabilota bacterium]|jgi:DnaJ-class molecular chaperone|nr:DnaJ C-terminal domain-containing protein [Methylomirabilota bacterium]